MNTRALAPALAPLVASVICAAACASSNVEDGSGTTVHDGGANDATSTTTTGSGDDDSGVTLGGGDDDDDASVVDAAAADGASSVTCDAGTTSCNGSCVDVSTDEANCGGCGAACGSGQMCTGGTCGCIAGYATCSGDAGVGDAGALICANLQTDVGNCGTCGNACSGIMGCSGGSCVAPVVVDSSGDCTLLDGTLNHALAVDASGHIYAALVCNGLATVAVSANGTSFGAGVSLGVSSADTVTNLALATSGTSVYAAIGTDAGTFFSLSTDGGGTWSTPTTLAATTPDGFLQIATNGTNVLVGTPSAVFRNSSSGVGSFKSSAVTGGAPSGGIGVASDGTVWLAAVSSSTVSLSKSTDGAMTFSAFASAGATDEYFPSFAFGPSSVAVVGTTPSTGDDALVSIAYATPTVETATTGIAPVAQTAHNRVVAIDANGVISTFGANGADVVAQSLTNGQLSAAVDVTSDEEVQNLAIAAGASGTAYGMWSVGANIRIFHFTF